MIRSPQIIRPRASHTSTVAERSSHNRSSPSGGAPAGWPTYLQRALCDHAVSRPSDPAEREAEDIAASIAREHLPHPPDRSVGRSAEALTPNHALPDQIRAPMERSFGTDFRDVRIHTDAASGDACRALNARAYTTGSGIHFRPEEYRPHDPRGRELIAHELTHVVQQRGTASTAVAPAVIQRQPATTAAPPEPLAISDDAADQTQWRRRVDRAVRAEYGIRGDAISGAQVDVVTRAEFARRFPTSQVEEILFNLFLSHGERHTEAFSQILDYNRHPYHLAGPSSPSAISQLRTFVQQGIGRGFFEGQTREYDVTTGQRFPVFRVTPRELIAGSVGGITDIAPNRRGQRHITLQIGAFVHTFVHEACHFYISNRFRDMAQNRTDGGEYLRGARISQVLLEGMAEYFTRQVMRANPAELGPPNEGIYEDEVTVVQDLIVTLGEASVRRAYFEGVDRDVRRVAAAIDEYKQTHEDLLVPGSVVDQRLSAPASTGLRGS